MLKSPLKKNTWMEKNLCRDVFLKNRTLLRNMWMEKSPFRMEISPFWTEKTLCRVFFSKKVQNTSEKNKWRNPHSEWRFLHSEWRKLSVEFVFQKKSSKRFWKTFEWRNLHSEWRFLHFNFLNGENSLLRLFSKKVPNASEQHLNGEISIQNGDFFILNGENSLLIFFF